MAALAAARSGHPDAQEEAASAEAFARSTGTNAALLLANLALAEAATDTESGCRIPQFGIRDRKRDRAATARIEQGADCRSSAGNNFACGAGDDPGVRRV